MTLSLSVRCTREEYLQFCAETAPKPAWVSATGLLLVLIAAAEMVYAGGVSQFGVLLMLCGVVCLLMTPLILPMLGKGEGGRRYDDSDDLRQAMQLTFTDDTVTVKSATVEGTFPLTLVTDVVMTQTMFSFSFADELTVCIPVRAMTDTEAATVKEILNKGN